MPIAQSKGFAAYLKEAMGQLRSVRSLAGTGLLSAVGVVLKALTLNLAQVLRVGISFLPLALAAYLYGPLAGGFVGVVIDVIGYLLNPTGPYFFGFTLNAFLNGVIYGLWLWNRPVRLWRCLAACATSIALVSFGLNPLWLHLLYGDAWLGLVVARLPLNAVVLPINTALLYGMLRLAEKYRPHLLKK